MSVTTDELDAKIRRMAVERAQREEKDDLAREELNKTLTELRQYIRTTGA